MVPKDRSFYKKLLRPLARVMTDTRCNIVSGKNYRESWRFEYSRLPSLQNRLPLLEKGQKPIINELQLQIHPIDVLFDTKKLLTVAYVRDCVFSVECKCLHDTQQQPMSRAFEKATEGAILYDVWSDYQHDLVTDAEQWGSHCVQAVAWDILGMRPPMSSSPNSLRHF